MERRFAGQAPLQTRLLPGGCFAQSERNCVCGWQPTVSAPDVRAFGHQEPQGLRDCPRHSAAPGWLATGSTDKTIRLWRGGSCRLGPLRGNTGNLSHLVALPNGVLASAGNGGTTILWG